MYSLSLAAPLRVLPHAPIFPPLPLDESPVGRREGGVPAPLYCPHRIPRSRRWRTAPGDLSVGHGPGAEGQQGTAQDQGTGAKGSNLTRDDGGPSGDDIKGPGNSGPDGGPVLGHDDGPLMDGTRGGPAQPRRPS